MVDDSSHPGSANAGGHRGHLCPVEGARRANPRTAWLCRARWSAGLWPARGATQGLLESKTKAILGAEQ